MTTETKARRPANAVAVPLPNPTPATVETLIAALGRTPTPAKSKVIDGVLHVAPDEGQAVVTAITEHMRAIMKADRSANAYREVQMRGVRNAVIAAHKGDRLEVPRPVRTVPQAPRPPRKATAKKAPAKAAAAKKAAPVKPAAEAPTPEAETPEPTASPKPLDDYEAAKVEVRALKDWEALPEAERGERPATPSHDRLVAASEKRAAKRSAEAKHVAAKKQVTPRPKATQRKAS